MVAVSAGIMGGSAVVGAVSDADQPEGRHLFILSGQSNMVGLKPEISFVPAVELAFGKSHVIVVKDAQGGQPIRRWYKQWKTPEGADRTKIGDLYDRLINKVKPAIEGQPLESITLVWMQGERDARESLGDLYADSLKGLIGQLKGDLGSEDINVVIGRLSDFCMDDSSYPHWTMVRTAQVKLAEEDARIAWVDTDDLNDKPGKDGTIRHDLHYTKDGYKILGQRFADAAGALIRGEAPLAAKSDMVETASEMAPGYEGNVPMPTISGVRYGPHERHVLDFWQADSDQPTPLVFVVHGGGWSGGSKERMSRFADARALLDAGISVVAINYRLMRHVEGVQPPVKVPLHDAARALQFVRSKAGEWNIDKARIGGAGGSAGACTCLWLLYHDDLADPDSDDPVARESTRLACAGVRFPQTTLDPQQMKEWTPNSRYGGHAFGKQSFAEFLADRKSLLPWIREYSPYALVTSDAPPACLFYREPPAMGEKQKDPTHTANFGIGLKKHCGEMEVGCEVVYPREPAARYETPTEYFIATLKNR